MDEDRKDEPRENEGTEQTSDPMEEAKTLDGKPYWLVNGVVYWNRKEAQEAAEGAID